MPLPPNIISVSAFLCERALIEGDSILSAIRIVDLFTIPSLLVGVAVPENVLPHIQAFGCVLIKAEPGKQEHLVQLKIQNTAGEMNDVGEPMKVPMENKPGMETMPTGAAIRVELNIVVKKYGTCYLCVFIDEQEVSRVPFTIQQQPSPEKTNG